MKKRIAILLVLAMVSGLVVACGNEGKPASGKKEEAEQLLEELTERYLSVEIECNYGGQPIYYYIISVE